MVSKMPKKVVDHFKKKPASRKTGRPIPPALKKYQQAHPYAKGAPKEVKQQAIKKKGK